MITAKDIIDLTKPFVEEEDDDNDNGNDDSKSPKMSKTGKGGKDDHMHEYDPSTDGKTTETNGHTHSYKMSDDMTGPAGDDDHVHPVPKHDGQES